MKISPKQRQELTEHIGNQVEGVVGRVVEAIVANANHVRPANVNLIVKIARNADDPSLIEVNVQQKIKAPKSKMSDITTWNEPEIAMAFRIGEEPGQQKLSDD